MYLLLFMQKQRARRLSKSVTLEKMESVTTLMSLWSGCRWSPRVTTWLGMTVTEQIKQKVMAMSPGNITRVATKTFFFFWLVIASCRDVGTTAASSGGYKY